jgi:protein-L-isoaspartate(D-aspartate) O-methyltransferase
MAEREAQVIEVIPATRPEAPGLARLQFEVSGGCGRCHETGGCGGVSISQPLCSKPKILLVADEIRPSDVVLNVGDATGYATAVLSRLAQTVVSLEADPEWAARSAQTLSGLGIDNAAVVQGAFDAGCPGQAPFDVIMLSGAVDEVSPHLRRQLADGGRLVGMIGAGRGVSRGVMVVRVGDTWGQRVLFDATTGRLPSAAAAAFVF